MENLANFNALMGDLNSYLEASWLAHLRGEFEQPYMKRLKNFLIEDAAAGKTIYPPQGLIFSAFNETPYDQVRVVIVGQDPYHGPGQAHGLSFSVPPGIALPPSLQNIFKELKRDLHVPTPPHGCLLKWARQGVLLLNATLTVRVGEPKSHFGQGWEVFTDRVIQILYAKKNPIVFVLWGKSAYAKLGEIYDPESPHLVLTAPHPSPLSAHRGFLGCGHFSKINEFLRGRGFKPIDWTID